MSTRRATTTLAASASEMADHVLAMLEVRASDGLPAWLADRLRGRSPGSCARVLQVHPARASRLKAQDPCESYAVAEGDEGRPAPVGDDAALRAVLRSRGPASVHGGGEVRLLVPFMVGGEVRHVIDLRGGVIVEPGDALVAVARKYHDRLVEGETDPLTRLSNRRLFQARAEAAMRRWAQSRPAHYFAMLDLDRFKRINDEFGHAYGDEILVLFANLMRATFRSADQLYRFGGEEFLVIFGVEPPERGGEGALERFRAAVEAYEFPGVGRVTVSIGFARVADAATPPAVLVERADEAMYYAKAHGRNRVCAWEALVAAGELNPKPARLGDVTLF